MIDINNSQEYDSATFNELLAEENKKRQINRLTSFLGGVSDLPQFPLYSPSPLSNVYLEVTSKAKEDLTDPIDFMKSHYPGERLWRFVLTHPDLDHMRGLKNLYENIGFDNFWDTDHTKPIPSYRSSADKEDWEFYQKIRNCSIGVKPKQYIRGDSLFAFAKDEYGNIGGDNIEILSPTPYLIRLCNNTQKYNDISLVLRVNHAGKSIILPGDAETAAWDAMESYYGENLKSSFMKASHHGRDSGYHLSSLKLIDPSMIFVSVGTKPDTDASNKYRQITGKKVPSTRYYGNIELRIYDNGGWEWSAQRNKYNS